MIADESLYLYILTVIKNFNVISKEDFFLKFEKYLDENKYQNYDNDKINNILNLMIKNWNSFFDIGGRIVEIDNKLYFFDKNNIYSRLSKKKLINIIFLKKKF